MASLDVKGSLVAGVLAGIGASVCCVGPRTLQRQRLAFWLVSVALLGLLAVPWLAPFVY